jgi:hypothetical protein
MAGPRDREQNQKDERRVKAAERRETKRREQGTFNMDGIPWLTLVALIAELAENGGAIRIGLTRDNGALALGFYHKNDYATEYIRPNEDLEATLHALAEIWLTDGLLGLERRMVSMGKGK